VPLLADVETELFVSTIDTGTPEQDYISPPMIVVPEI